MILCCLRLITLVILGVLMAGRSRVEAVTDCPVSRPQRVVSLSPSITEMIIALGAGERLVGITRYCDPPSGASCARLGGYQDVNYEALLGLRPDLVVLLAAHHEAKAELEKMRLRTLTVPHSTIADIHTAIRLIGEACGRADQARALEERLLARSAAVQGAVGGRLRLRVLICIGRDTSADDLVGIYVAGRRGFYDEIIEQAGGVNVCPDNGIAYPQLAAEGIVQLNPEVIIDLVSSFDASPRSPEAMRRQWEQLRVVSAVRQNRVHVIAGSHALRPGPRYIEFLEQLALLLHPDAFSPETNHE